MINHSYHSMYYYYLSDYSIILYICFIYFISISHIKKIIALNYIQVIDIVLNLFLNNINIYYLNEFIEELYIYFNHFICYIYIYFMCFIMFINHLSLANLCQLYIYYLIFIDQILLHFIQNHLVNLYFNIENIFDLYHNLLYHLVINFIIFIIYFIYRFQLIIYIKNFN